MVMRAGLLEARPKQLVLGIAAVEVLLGVTRGWPTSTPDFDTQPHCQFARLLSMPVHAFAFCTTTRPRITCCILFSQRKSLHPRSICGVSLRPSQQHLGPCRRPTPRTDADLKEPSPGRVSSRPFRRPSPEASAVGLLALCRRPCSEKSSHPSLRCGVFPRDLSLSARLVYAKQDSHL